MLEYKENRASVLAFKVISSQKLQMFFTNMIPEKREKIKLA